VADTARRKRVSTTDRWYQRVRAPAAIRPSTATPKQARAAPDRLVTADVARRRPALGYDRPMSEWKPRVKSGLRWESLSLTAEDGFLLSRIDGTTSVMGLSHVTGLPLAQVQDGLRRLRASGALDVEPTPTPSSGGSAAAVATRAPVRTAAAPAPSSTRPAQAPAVAHGPSGTAPGDADLADDDLADDDLFDDLADADEPSLEGEATLEGDAVDEAQPAARAGRDAVVVDDAPDAPVSARAEDADAGKDAADDEKSDEEGGGKREGDEEAEAESDDNEDAAVEEGNYRKLYETTLHTLPQDEREKLAKTASGPVLLALCFDPVPQVIGGIFENPECGFSHARLVARHHRTPQGLDDVLRRAEFARDAQVQRFLLANPMLNDAQLKKLLSPKRLDVIYKWTLSRDLPEKNRAKVRLILRSKWSTADGEARAHLIFTTEGRVLTMLIGLPFDSQTTTLLCARTYNSLMLIQNLARFSATPPQVLQHLLKQALVKRQPHLRTLIAQHPNCPSDVKRKLREGS
jgi:hypothetical protein